LKRQNPSALLIQELLEVFPNSPSLTLAKKAYSLAPELWRDLEATRSMVRFYRGASGKKSRQHSIASRDFSKKLFNPFDFPQSDEAEYLPYILPEDCRKILWLSDVHVPYHNLEALTAAVEIGIMEQADTIFLAGDFMDFYGISTYEKDARKRSFSGELEMGKTMLQKLRGIFPDQRFFFMVGNHEERLERYMRVKAPELLDCEQFRIQELLGFESLDIEVINGKRICHAGDLVLMHGHEFGRGSGGAFPARALMLKAKTSAICGHWHRPSDHAENDVNGNVMRAWSTGCLCELNPEYMPLNNWGHGCAVITVEDGHASVQNYRIQDGEVI